MSPLDPDIPPAGEEIHLPGGSVQPVVLAFAIMVALIGVTTTILLTIAGGLVSLWVIFRWIREARSDIDELPLDHH